MDRVANFATLQTMLCANSAVAKEIEKYKSMGAKARTFPCPPIKKTCKSVAWNATGDKLAYGGEDGTITVYPTPTVKRAPVAGSPQTLTTAAHTDSVTQIVWHPTDENRFMSVSLDKSCKVFDLRFWPKPIHSLLSSDGLVAAAWSPDGTKIAVTTKERRLQMIDFAKFTTERLIKFGQGYEELSEIKWSPDTLLFFVATTNLVPGGTIEVLDGRTINMKDKRTLSAHTAAVYCLDIDRTGRYFATGASDALVNIWDLQELICLRSLSNTEDSVRSVSFSYDGKLIAAVSDQEITINHVETGEKVHSITGTFLSAAFHPTKNILAYGGDEDSKHGRTGLIFVQDLELPVGNK